MHRVWYSHYGNNVKMNIGTFGETFWVTLKGAVGIKIPIKKEVTTKNGDKKLEEVMFEVAQQGV